MNKEETIIFKIKTVSNILKRRVREIVKESHDYDITDAQILITKYLHDNENKDIFQKDLEEKFCIRRSTVTNILHIMEKNNLIIRKKVDYDARLKKIVLTEKSNQIHAKICKEISDIEENMLKNISKEEIYIFSKTLDKIKDNLF